MSKDTNTIHAPVLQAKVNSTGFLKEASKFFSADSWFSELLQNAYRSGATTIKIRGDADKQTCIIEDDGKGIDLSQWEGLLEMATSEWEERVQSEQNPAGMGIFAALLKYPATITSRGWKLSTTPEDIIEQRQLRLEEAPFTTGCKVELTGIARFPDIPKKLSGVSFQLNSKTPLFLDIQHIQNGSLHHNYAGNALESPWAIKTLVAGDSVVVSMNQPFLTNNHLVSRSVDLELPVFEGEGFRIVPHIEHGRSRCWLAMVSQLVFHGQVLSLPNNWSRSLLGFDVHVYGKAPFDLKLPDRCEVIENEKWEQFCETVAPYREECISKVDDIVNPKGIHPVFLVGQFSVAEVSTQDDLFQYNNYSENNSNSIPLYKQASALGGDLLQSSGLFASLPDAYSEIDYLMEAHNGGIEWEDEERETAGCSLMRALETVAKQGAVRIGISTKSTEGIPAPSVSPDDLSMTRGEKLETVTLPEAAGKHTIEVYKTLELSHVSDSHKWSVDVPFIAIGTGTVNETYGCDFFCNKAYRALMQSNPGRACDMLITALTDSFEAREECDSPYDADCFEIDCAFHEIRTFFHHQQPSMRTVHFAKVMLKDLSADIDRLLRGKHQFFLTKFLHVAGKFEVLATIQSAEAVHKIILQDDLPVRIETTERKR